MVHVLTTPLTFGYLEKRCIKHRMSSAGHLHRRRRGIRVAKQRTLRITNYMYSTPTRYHPHKVLFKSWGLKTGRCKKTIMYSFIILQVINCALLFRGLIPLAYYKSRRYRRAHKLWERHMFRRSSLVVVAPGPWLHRHRTSSRWSRQDDHGVLDCSPRKKGSVGRWVIPKIQKKLSF